VPGLPIVLVHGGAHGAWCWDALVASLVSPVCAVDLPPVSVRGGPDRNVRPPGIDDLALADWAAAVLAAADDAGFDRCVLVGHSLAGLTLCEVARRAPARVAHLVFVSALVPPEGVHAVDAMPQEMIDRVAGGLTDAILADMFCNDLDAAQTRFVIEHVGTEVASVMIEPVTRVGMPAELPKTYLRLGRDHALPLAAQDASIAALEAVPGGRVVVVDIDSGHNVMISRPAELAAILDGIAGAEGIVAST
jgi:pimeloyl-ACP methyl ester carboxylesterase